LISIERAQISHHEIEGTCAIRSRETLRLYDKETVELEYRDPLNQWVADLAVLNEDKTVRFIIEVYHTYKTQNHVLGDGMK